MKTTETYKGINIEIEHDTDAQNPFKDWDCNLPLMKVYDRYFEDYSDGDINQYLSEVLTDGQILRHQKEIAEAFEIDLDYFIEQEFSKDDKISDIRYDISKSKDFDALEKICILSKTPYLNTCSRGYSQGDYADIFTCYTSKFEEVTGCKKEQINEKELQNNVDLWGYWAWGDVYGYSIEETGDSCWGYYGDNYEQSGLLEQAKSAIDYYLKEKKETRINKLKQLIKSKVDLTHRKQILATL